MNRNGEVLRIGVDLDAVVFDVVYPIKKYLSVGLGIDSTKSSSWHIYDFSTWPEVVAISGGPEYLKKAYHRRGFYRFQGLVDGVYEALTILRDRGDEIFVITARHEDVAGDITRERLDHYGLGWLNERSYFVNHRPGSMDKSEIGNALGLNVFIEDHAGNAFKMNSSSIRLKLLFNYPWNTYEQIDVLTKRVNGWRDSLIEIDGIRR